MVTEDRDLLEERRQFGCWRARYAWSKMRKTLTIEQKDQIAIAAMAVVLKVDIQKAVQNKALLENLYPSEKPFPDIHGFWSFVDELMPNSIDKEDLELLKVMPFKVLRAFVIAISNDHTGKYEWSGLLSYLLMDLGWGLAQNQESA